MSRGYSEVLKLAGLLMLLKLTLVSDEGVIGARQSTFEQSANGRLRVLRGRLRPVTAHAAQQGGSSKLPVTVIRPPTCCRHKVRNLSVIMN